MKNNLMPKEQSWEEEIIKEFVETFKDSSLFDSWDGCQKDLEKWFLRKLSDRDAYWLKKIEEGLPEEMPSNGFMITRKSQYGDKESGFNYCLSEIKKKLLK